MEQNVKGELGAIRLHEKVISSLAMIATKEVEGVARLGSCLKSVLYSCFKFNYTGVISVHIDSDNSVSVNIPIVVTYGYNLPEVASRVQENIRRMIEKSTDLNVKQIDVSIQAVERRVEK